MQWVEEGKKRQIYSSEKFPLKIRALSIQPEPRGSVAFSTIRDLKEPSFFNSSFSVVCKIMQDFELLETYPGSSSLLLVSLKFFDTL